MSRLRYRNPLKADHGLTADGSADEYTHRLASIPGILLNNVIFHQSSLSRDQASLVRNNICGFRKDSVLSTSNLSRLPMPNSSIDVISARSLHKTIQAGRGSEADPADVLRRCLEECHRILVPGGRFEYIYFGNQLLPCGPLTGELEPFLEEVWTESSALGRSQILPDTNDFLGLLDHVGFKDGRHRTMNFGLFTLRSIYDYRGVPRSSEKTNTTPTVLTVEQQRSQKQQLGTQHCPTPGTPGQGTYIHEKACELLLQVHEECTLRETGWKCVMGYATKHIERIR